jgi:TrmH family RNA methyltransferase
MIAMERMERITSRQNAVVKRFRDLARSSRTSFPGDPPARAGVGATGEILLDGEHLVQEALASGIPVELAAFCDRQASDVLSPLGRLAADVRARGGRALLVSDQVLAAISPVQHPSGVVAIGRGRAADVRSVLAAAGGGRALLPHVPVLAGVPDPGNVGAIVRAAAAFGAAGLVAVDGSANPFGWKSLRGAMGGTFRLPIAARGTAEEVSAAAHALELRIIAAVPRGGTPVAKADFRTPTIVLLGGEGAGVSSALLAAAHGSFSIPMREPIESLNVAVAAAIVFYEAARQVAT